MAIVTFSDGQTVDPSGITRVTLYTMNPKRLFVEVGEDKLIKVFGPGVYADAEMLNRVRDEKQLSFSCVRTAKHLAFYSMHL